MCKRKKCITFATPGNGRATADATAPAGELSTFIGISETSVNRFRNINFLWCQPIQECDLEVSTALGLQTELSTDTGIKSVLTTCLRNKEKRV